MKKTLISAVVATFAGTMAIAQSATDQIINDLTGQGFQRIEIDNGIGQIKVEAIRGTQKLEVVYDRATGAILKQEVERVRAGEDTRPGVEIRNRNRDFVDAGRVSDDSSSTSTSASQSTTTTTTTTTSTGSSSTDDIVRDLQAQGYTRIEIKNGATQTKVEAIRGTEKVETVFDRATGDVIKQEVETVDSGDDTRPGVEIRTRDRDFVDGSGSDDDDDDDDRRSGRDDDSDDNSGSGRGSDDDGDDDRGRDRDRSDDDDDDDDDDRGRDRDRDDDSDDDDDDDSDDDDDDDDD